MLEGIIFIGIQASGKSTFYKERFFNTHIHINNDMLKTKNREKLLIDYCKNAQISFVLDNTNVSKEIRLKYIHTIKEIGYKTIGYYFKTDLEQALLWNQKRTGKENIPKVGILATHKKLDIPSIEEGFDELYYVEIENNKFIVKEWQNEI
jgi:predicted kinase